MSDNSMVDDLKKEMESLKDNLRKKDQIINNTTNNNPFGSDVGSLAFQLKPLRVLKGHSNKIYTIDWCKTTGKLVSASQDNTIILWNPQTGTKFFAQQLECQWVMSCAYSASGRFVASGGLDDKATVFNVENARIGKAAQTFDLPGHEGFISCISFVNDQAVITASGDSTAKMWDLQTRKEIMGYNDAHEGSIEQIAVDEAYKSMISCSVDTSAVLWDIKSGTNIRTFKDHEKDVNDAKFLPGNSNNYFLTASDDGYCFLYDRRNTGPLSRYQMPDNAPLTSCDVSLSGRLCFAASHNSSLFAFDILKGDGNNIQQADDSGSNVTCVRVSPDGYALASSGWSELIHVWSTDF